MKFIAIASLCPLYRSGLCRRLLPQRVSQTLGSCVIPAAYDHSASLISQYYPNEQPTIKPAESTSLASALYSVETSWQGSPQYTSANAAIYSAAPADVKSSIDINGYYYRSITGQAWYIKNVPNAVQTAVAGEISAFSLVGAKILGTSTSSGNAAARTAAPVIVGVMGLVGGVFAAM